MNALINFLEELKGVQSFSFEVGYMAALGFVLALIVLAVIAYLVFFKYPRRSPGVCIQSQNGSIFIAAHAVSDLVKSLEAEFKDIEIAKVHLLDCKKFTRIEIQLDYAIGGQSMSEIAPLLQERTLDTLREVFGIANIRDVSVKVRRAVANQSPFA